MARIAVDLGNIFVPGITVWREANVEVIQYSTDTPEGKKVFGVMEHRSPQQTAFIGFYDSQNEAVANASKAL